MIFRLGMWIGHILRRNCILRDVIEGKIESKRSLGRRRLQVLDDLREKDEAQERELWRKKFAVSH